VPKKIAASILGVMLLLALCAPAVSAFETGPAPQDFCPLELELDMMRRGLANVNVFTDGLLVLQGGKIIYERYAPGWGRDTPHRMYSVTKSIVSALVGIAIGEKKIESVKQKVAEFYPDATIAPGQECKLDMTIEHLLTHSSGLPGDSDSSDAAWWDAPDSGRAAFEMPQAAAPGERYAYSSGPGMQALGGLLSRAVGMDLFDYAKLKLFGPLGMDSVTWDTAAGDGRNYGGFGIAMTPEDMLRFGILLLNDGVWEGKRIIPSEYIKAAHPPSPNRDNYGYLFRSYSDSPGYEDALRAAGFFGQFICILPEQDMVIVRTGSAGPVVKTVIGAALGNEIANWLFMHIIYPIAPLHGVPLRYFMETM